MRILFVSNVYPPEVAPLANRLSEHARTWVAEGAELEVICPNPNYPEGVLYPGYKNSFGTEDINGVRVTRVPTFLAPNKGSLFRTLSYISFMLSAIFFSRRSKSDADVVVASSPHIFSAVAGLMISRRLSKPFILEIRDLWPDSIVAVGASKRNWLIRKFEQLEMYLYREADRIIVVTDTFKKVITEKGIPASKIDVVKNGAVIPESDTELDDALMRSLVSEHRLEGKFVASYIGTIGMAHRVDQIFEAAKLCDDPDIIFLVAGSGAERENLEEKLATNPLENFRLLDKVPKETAKHLMAVSDISIVHLKDTPVFKTVLPSKLFDAMVLKKPIVLGVRGESKMLVDQSGSGISIEPENPKEMVEAVRGLKNNAERVKQMGDRGYKYLRDHHDRSILAKRYLDIMRALTPVAEVQSHSKVIAA